MNKKKLLLQGIKKVRSQMSLTRKNTQDESYQLSVQKDYYEKADEYMGGKTYLDRRLGWFKFSKGFRRFYHVISVVLAIITAGLLTTRYLDIFSFDWLSILLLILTFLLLLILFGSLEWGKKEKATDVFYKLASKGKAPVLQSVYLGLFVITSLLISAVGGALIGDRQVDKSQKFTSEKNTQTTQIKSEYAPRLAQLATTIAALENLATNPKLRRWGLTREEQANLLASKTERDTLMAKQQYAIEQTNSFYTKVTKENYTYRLIGMGIGFGVVLCLELLLVYAYYFHSLFMKRVQIEGVQNEILPDPAQGNVEVNEIASLPVLLEGLISGFQGTMVQMIRTLKEELSPTEEQRSEISLRPSGVNPQPDGDATAKTGKADMTAANAALEPAKGKAAKTDVTGKAGVPVSAATTTTSSSVVTTSIQAKDNIVKRDTTGKAGVSAKSKKGKPATTAKTGLKTKKVTPGTTINRKRGYYIPPECFEKYFAGRDRQDDPYRKLRWYDAVIPDLQAGLKYREILEKEYQVFDYQQQREVTKSICETTLKTTIVRGLKSLADEG